MWKVKVVDFNSRPSMSVMTIATCDTKAEAVEYLRGRKNIMRIGNTYILDKNN